MNDIDFANAVAKLLSRKDMTRAELARRCIAAENTAAEERAQRINLECDNVALKGQLAAPITTPQPAVLNHRALMLIARDLAIKDGSTSYRVGLGCVERFNQETRTWSPVQL
jgi:hypothetical protein